VGAALHPGGGAEKDFSAIHIYLKTLLRSTWEGKKRLTLHVVGRDSMWGAGGTVL